MPAYAISAKSSASDDSHDDIYQTANAIHEYIASLLAGEELIGDRFLSHQRVTEDWKFLTFNCADLDDIELLVVGEPARLGRLILGKAFNEGGGFFQFRDSATVAGSAVVLELDIQPVANGIMDCRGMRFTNGITIELDNPSGEAGTIIVEYREAEFEL